MRKWVLCFQVIWGLSLKSPYEVVINSLKDWGIEGKVSTFTWQNMYLNDEEHDEFVDMVKAQVQSKQTLQLNGQLFHVKCCAWMFKSMVEDAFKEIYTIIDKVSMLSRFEFEPVWYFNTAKLKTALELHSAGALEEHELPSEDEWRKVESLIKLADIAYDTAKVLFETKYPTANIYLHNLLELRVNLTKESSSSCAFTSKLAKIMLTKLDKYYKSNFMVLALATVMDPRYKMKYIEYMVTKCKNIDWDPQGKHVEEAIRSVYEVYVEAETENRKCDCKKEEKSGGKWVDEYEKFVEKDKEVEKSDLELYLEGPVESFSKEFDVLTWWKSEEPKYPIMSKMARDILGIPMSVANSGDAFYTHQRPARVDVPKSGYDFVDAVMCTRSWSENR